MPLTCGLVGLPNAGKSTLFRAITAAPAEIAPYPFTTIAPNVGVAPVPDPRLQTIAAITHARRVVPAALEVVDIAGLVRNAHRGEGLGNQFLARIREVDALLHVVRCFAGGIAHVEGAVDPLRDIGIVETEMLLADVAAVERWLAQVSPRARTGDREAREQEAALVRLRAHLNSGHPANTLAPPAPAGTPPLLTGRPMLYVANLGEDAAPGAARTPATPCLDAVAAHARETGTLAVGVAARLEMELAELPEADAAEFAASMGWAGRALPRLIAACQALLGLRTFFSTASAEVRAWPVPAGTRAPQAAGRVHTDMERGFIRAEVVGFDDLVRSGSLGAARERGLLRLEGRDYEIREGDVITFRFAV